MVCVRYGTDEGVAGKHYNISYILKIQAEGHDNTAGKQCHNLHYIHIRLNRLQAEHPEIYKIPENQGYEKLQ